MTEGLGFHEAVQENEDDQENGKDLPEAHGGLDLEGEVLSIGTNCPNCNAPACANFKTVSIPFFKDVIIMATVCDKCGYKSNEVKSGTGFEEKGRKIELTISGNLGGRSDLDHKVDLARDVLKSETCSIAIPDLDFEIGRGAIEGKFTTIEGLIQDIDRVVTRNPFTTGDSAMVEAKANVEKFNIKIQEILEGKRKVTLVLDDPAGNSYVQNPNAPEADSILNVIDYERTFEQMEDLGLNQMVVENY